MSKRKQIKTYINVHACGADTIVTLQQGLGVLYVDDKSYLLIIQYGN